MSISTPKQELILQLVACKQPPNLSPERPPPPPPGAYRKPAPLLANLAPSPVHLYVVVVFDRRFRPSWFSLMRRRKTQVGRIRACTWLGEGGWLRCWTTPKTMYNLRFGEFLCVCVYCYITFECVCVCVCSS